MRLFVVSLAVTLVAGMAVAQQSGSPEKSVKTFASSAEAAALLAKAKADRKDGQALVSESLLQLAPYIGNLEYRASVGDATVHVREAELMYVIDGTATMITGGKLVNESRKNPDNPRGSAIEGGLTREISKGDFIIVPENTPHWFSSINGALVLMTFHVPRPVPTEH
jgi:mannose-6-phosphate isomerase-like protein (cupin superfamily)